MVMKKLLTEWRKYLREGDEGDLEFLLLPPGETAQIGDEKGRAPRPGENAILRYRTDHGSYRYVKVVDGQIIAGLQVMSRDLWRGKEPAIATIANVYTHPDFRRQGHAADLLAKAKQSFDKVLHSKDLTSTGSRWKSGVES
jgi:predicted GNAT family acetyltransferase